MRTAWSCCVSNVRFVAWSTAARVLCVVTRAVWVCANAVAREASVSDARVRSDAIAAFVDATLLPRLPSTPMARISDEDMLDATTDTLDARLPSAFIARIWEVGGDWFFRGEK